MTTTVWGPFRNFLKKQRSFHDSPRIQEHWLLPPKRHQLLDSTSSYRSIALLLDRDYLYGT